MIIKASKIVRPFADWFNSIISALHNIWIDLGCAPKRKFYRFYVSCSPLQSLSIWCNFSFHVGNNLTTNSHYVVLQLFVYLSSNVSVVGYHGVFLLLTAAVPRGLHLTSLWRHFRRVFFMESARRNEAHPAVFIYSSVRLKRSAISGHLSLN